MKKYVKELLKKKNLIYELIFIVDFLLIIYCARDNFAQYVIFNNKKLFFGKTRNLLLGRNYITLVINTFVWIYMLILKRFYFKDRINWVKYIIFYFMLLLINVLLFYTFTVRVY